MVLVIDAYFGNRAKSQDLYEFIGYMKDSFAKDYKEVTYLKNDLFYVNFFESIREINVFDGKV